MFNFTTQTVYNLITTATVAQKGDRVSKNANLIINTVLNGHPVLRIGNTRFDAADVLDVQIKKPSLENLASVSFDLAKILAEASKGDITARIALYVGLSMNSQDSFYANDSVYKGKPLYIEFPVKKNDTVDILSKRVKSIADKYLLFVVGPEKILDVTIEDIEAVAASGTEGNPDYVPAKEASKSITFTGVNGYQQIKKAVLQKYNPEAKTIDCCAYSGDYVDVITGVPAAYEINSSTGLADISDNKKVSEEGLLVDIDAETEVPIAPGLEAFGDYNWIIHNLRLPTAANTNFWAYTKDEMPVPGQVYTQFIIRICKERDGIMGEIVGARGTSVTTHVLYVAGDAALDGTTTTTAADKVYNALFTSNGLNLASAKKFTDADTALATPFANVPDAE